MNFFIFLGAAVFFAFVARGVDPRKNRLNHWLAIVIALVLISFAIASAGAQVIPPPSPAELKTFNASVQKNDTCQWAIRNQHDAATNGASVKDWRVVAAGWKVCGIVLRQHHADPSLLHVPDYELVQVCERLYAIDSDDILKACE
jgi:hypothetical protein